jgi:(1->4)-alpha-D-glucan 1-alpha-D-glucosylmutase
MSQEALSGVRSEVRFDQDDALLMALQQRLAQHARVPVATYRLQFNATFTFTQARQLVPYLHALGISTCYASPYLKARPGSLHGYDIVDHQILNPEIGSAADYDAFTHTLQEHDMSQLLDIVPNHMGIVGGENSWWMDVLENGPSSVYATFFDIDWQPPKAELHNKVLLPILGDHYGKVLENQELSLTYAAGGFMLHYYEHRLPLAPRSTTAILQDCLQELLTSLGETAPQTLELQSIITSLRHLPPRTTRDPERIAERYREKEVCKRRLAALYDSCPECQLSLERTLHTFNGTRGEPRSFDRLDALLDGQAYRLSFWRTAADEINYRRFFDINDLAALRMEELAVFVATHDFILRLLTEGKITGVRIDHPDGLLDPAGYFHRLQQAYVWRHYQALRDVRAEALAPDAVSAAAALLARAMAASPDQPQRDSTRPLYIVVEKILGNRERLPPTWPVHGTTGYDFLNQLNGLFVDRTKARTFRNLYAAFVGERLTFQDVLYAAKKLILETAMAGELHVLGAHLDRLSETNRWWRDFTRNNLTAALREVIASFPVYRTYISAEDLAPAAADRVVIDVAVDRARRRNPAMSASVFDYVHDILRLHYPENSDATAQQAQRLFVQKFQQITGPVMAKGLEDTAFYRYTLLASLNEVGGNPDQFGITVAAFHQQNLERHERCPLALLATSTHDTKRGEDVRARLNVLSEIPQVWRACLRRWHRLNRPHLSQVDGQAVPDRQEEYLLYQTLLGAWPPEPLSAAEAAAFRERLLAYMRKALREAKVHTSWNNQHVAYEQAVEAFIEALLDDTRSGLFLEDFRAVQQMVAHYGVWNGLAQTLLKLTSPGVPDIYQGSELWDLSLVDPDNRRPVDYALRQQLLADLQQHCQGTGRLDLVRELLHTRDDGRIKLYVIWQTLTYRQSQAQLFLAGDYVPLDVAGSKREHVCAFARVHGTTAALVLVPRLLTGLLPTAQDVPLGPAVWNDTWVAVPESLGAAPYRHLLTGETVQPTTSAGHLTLPLAAVFATFPVALLQRLAV